MPANGRSCATCEWWQRATPDPKWEDGYCRWRPYLNKHSDTCWPITKTHDWCGAWKKDEGPKEGHDAEE